ncbi:hypothetical protein KC19_11G108400 [Ceratodon purpureus]|uniref:Cytochrome b561 and DOMON domain-containing protein n=1 Tax=Ceratodon purpureus TaxID=3225 RepID=A0A8T0GCQ0_CERPU|nr:hypothetical protein KC19_11G108400 [Ceratodon purpureus]
MASAWTWILVTTLLALAQGANAVCSTSISNRVFASCQDLPSLGASYAWTFNNATNSVDFAFTEDMQVAGGWVAWGINPTNGPIMPGTQALVAFQNSTALTVKEYNVTLDVRDSGAPLLPSPVSVNYTNISAEVSSTVVTIFGTFALAAGQSAKINQVWNRGSAVALTNFQLAQHDLSPANLLSAGNIDLSTGIATAAGLPHQKLKNTHGVFNAVAWGILLPIGVMSARYLRMFAWADPLWFYMHIACQLTGYTLGVVGWGLGLQLQKYATPIKYYHRNLGIAIFVFATLQVLAVVLRPKKESKVRPFWNVYHHTIGYLCIILIIVNIFEGFELLEPASKWKRAYVAVLIVLGVVSLVLEVLTWIVWFRRRQQSKLELKNQV